MKEKKMKTPQNVTLTFRWKINTEKKKKRGKIQNLEWRWRGHITNINRTWKSTKKLNQKKYWKRICTAHGTRHTTHRNITNECTRTVTIHKVCGAKAKKKKKIWFIWNWPGDMKISALCVSLFCLSFMFLYSLLISSSFFSCINFWGLLKYKKIKKHHHHHTHLLCNKPTCIYIQFLAFTYWTAILIHVMWRSQSQSQVITIECRCFITCNHFATMPFHFGNRNIFLLMCSVCECVAVLCIRSRISFSIFNIQFEPYSWYWFLFYSFSRVCATWKGNRVVLRFLVLLLLLLFFVFVISLWNWWIRSFELILMDSEQWTFVHYLCKVVDRFCLFLYIKLN